MSFLRSCLLGRQFRSLVTHRYLCSASTLSEGEQKIVSVLKLKFPEATQIEVEDISGGCGAMYEILVESNVFKGKVKVKQHQMINKALQEEIKEMHGLRITTRIPADS